MTRRCLRLLLLFSAIALSNALTDTAEARRPAQYSLNPAASRAAEIRRMPLLQRPNRPGHFIGNTIRRNHYRRTRGRL